MALPDAAGHHQGGQDRRELARQRQRDDAADEPSAWKRAKPLNVWSAMTIR